MCPHMKNIKYFSTTSVYLNSDGEKEAKQTLNPTMDLLKNAMSKGNYRF